MERRPKDHEKSSLCLTAYSNQHTTYFGPYVPIALYYFPKESLMIVKPFMNWKSGLRRGGQTVREDGSPHLSKGAQRAPGMPAVLYSLSRVVINYAGYSKAAIYSFFKGK